MPETFLFHLKVPFRFEFFICFVNALNSNTERIKKNLGHAWKMIKWPFWISDSNGFVLLE